MQTKILTLALLATLAAGAWQASSAGPGPRVNAGGSALKHLDVDGDGVISLAEFVDARLIRAENRFNRRDDNGDGFITEDEIGRNGEPPSDEQRAEFRECLEQELGIELPEPPEPGSRFDEADANGDGAIDLAEALAVAEQAAESRFNAIDGNADGVLDTEELAAAVRKGRAVREARRSCREQVQEVDDVLGG